VPPARQDRFRVAGWLLLSALLAFALPAMARSHRRAARAAARREHSQLSAQALQSRRLEKGKAALTRLKADRRRRRYRDGWEAVARQADAAVRADPSGPRAAEAAFFAARVREELWNVSRTRRDAVAAIASYRSVDERYSGTEPAAHALAAGVRLAARVKDVREGALLGRRLSRYPRTAEAASALSLVRVPARSAQARRAPMEPGTRPAAKGDRAAQRPTEPRARPPPPAGRHRRPRPRGRPGTPLHRRPANQTPTFRPRRAASWTNWSRPRAAPRTERSRPRRRR
jgi:hypothetical protein